MLKRLCPNLITKKQFAKDIDPKCLLGPLKWNHLCLNLVDLSIPFQQLEQPTKTIIINLYLSKQTNN